MTETPTVHEPALGTTVTHCNPRTEYEIVDHGYRPSRCPECALIRRIVLYGWKAR